MDKVEQIRAQIAAGTYETEAKIDATVDAVIAELEHDDEDGERWDGMS